MPTQVLAGRCPDQPSIGMRASRLRYSGILGFGSGTISNMHCARVVGGCGWRLEGVWLGWDSERRNKVCTASASKRQWKGDSKSKTRTLETSAKSLGDNGRGVEDIMARYSTPSQKPTESVSPYGMDSGMGNGVFLMLFINFALHTMAYFWNPSWISTLALSHLKPHWWQFVTAAFVHANWEHLFGNAFSLLVFGRMVEEEEGALGLWITYLICGVSGNVASYLSSPGSLTVSLGASSAVFGLFIVGVLTKLRPSVQRLLEALILGSYVIKQVLQEVQIVASGSSMVVGQMSVGHMAHLGGAAAGVMLVILLSRLPPVE